MATFPFLFCVVVGVYCAGRRIRKTFTVVFENTHLCFKVPHMITCSFLLLMSFHKFYFFIRFVFCSLLFYMKRELDCERILGDFF